ncbi:MAG: nucleotidyl transferase AbiEii/AbiGii toxin family protein [Saprospiraceae bacterium]|nr:nucleotidyl transferase AbiEii/AbiGii toxin family protein [Saprospiraceae bacterium]
MSSLQINFDNLRSGPFRNVFDALEAAFEQYGIDFYVIGAFARDIWLGENDRLPGLRATLDLDLAVYISNWEDYEALKNYLIATHGFLADKEPYRLHNNAGQIIGLIPFGGVEKDRQVYIAGTPPIQLSVFGTQEVARHAVPVSQGFRIITLPGLCIMKLIAWSDRSDWRHKDLQDFWFLLEHYEQIEPMLIFEAPFLPQLESEEELDLDIAYARIMGIQMNDILYKDKQLKKQVLSILERIKGTYTDAEIIEMYNADATAVLVKRWRLAMEVKRGILE